jgi:hypothetical protein
MSDLVLMVHVYWEKSCSLVNCYTYFGNAQCFHVGGSSRTAKIEVAGFSETSVTFSVEPVSYEEGLHI